jgi:hypothetical protein
VRDVIRCQLAYSSASYTKEWIELAVYLAFISQGQSHIATDGQSISKSRCRAPAGTHDQILLTV